MSRRKNGYRPLPLLCAAVLAVALPACLAGAQWSLSGLQPAAVSPAAARLAYAQVLVDISGKPDLNRLGFTAAHGARSLSALGVQEYFMPRTSRQFDRLDPAIRACFEGLDRCTAMVVQLGEPPQDGLLAAHAAEPAGHIVFLLRSGRVVYKDMIEG
jgi:hypothetical protein